MKRLFILMALVCGTLALITDAHAATDFTFRQAVLEQDASNPDLVSSLNSTVIRVQKKALMASAKIVTNLSLKNLVHLRSQLIVNNTRAYCVALGQMHLISETNTGVAGDLELREKATVIAAELTSAAMGATHCFEAFAKLASRAHDAKMEELFKSFRLDNPAVRLLMSSQDASQLVLSLYFHRMTTFNAQNPTDRYWFSAEFKKYLRHLELDQDRGLLVRQAWARVAYLSQDEDVVNDYNKLMKDGDPTIKIISFDLINMFDKTDTRATFNGLSSTNYQVVVAALLNAIRLGKIDELYNGHRNLLKHAQKQVRRTYLQAVQEKIQLAEVADLVNDKSIGLRQLAAQIYMQRAALDEKIEFAQKILAGDDFGLKKGVIDASAEIIARQNFILKTALQDKDLQIGNYTMTFIQGNKIKAMYPQVLEKLVSADPDQRYEAVLVLLDSADLQNRLQMILDVFKNSQQLQFESARFEIINAILASEKSEEKALIPELLKIETNWRFANKLGEGLVKAGLGEYTKQEPKFTSVAADHYFVEQTRPLIKIQTTQGTMVFQLFYDIAPLHVAHFLYSVDHGLLNQNFFHRVVDNFVVQASRPYTADRLENGAVRAEILSLRQTRGTIAMPRDSYLQSGNADGFYINLITNFSLNPNYTLFGKLVAGDAVLDQLEIGDRVLGISRVQ